MKNTNMKILVIDDEAALAALIRSDLEEEHYDVETATDGELGSRLAIQVSFDLVILDYVLPKKDGRTVLKEIKKEKPSLPVILLTVKNGLGTRQEVFFLGADDFISKPFRLRELRLRVEAVLGRIRKRNIKASSFEEEENACS